MIPSLLSGTLPARHVSAAIQFIMAQEFYRNPFKPGTKIRYGLPGRLHAILTVYNALCQLVAVLTDGEEESGYHNGQSDASGLAGGFNLFRLAAGDSVQTHRVTVLRKGRADNA